MKKVIEFNESCQSCNGTGLYVGMGERDGAAVVCHICNGTGSHKFRHEYEDFTGRKDRPGVTRVFQTNPGICIGTGHEHRLADFGGITIEEWKNGKAFGRGTENRKYTCPAWWYQSANYQLKPDWDECSHCGSFSHCEHFTDKDKCWVKWDRENKL